jgi:hypothetical protein
MHNTWGEGEKQTHPRISSPPLSLPGCLIVITESDMLFMLALYQ